MSCSVLHHVEVCVKDDKIIRLLTTGFGFIPFAHRVTPAASKLALRSGDSVFVVVKRNSQLNRPQDQKRNTAVGEDGACVNEVKDYDWGKDENELITLGKPVNQIVDGGNELITKPVIQIVDGSYSNADTSTQALPLDDNEHWTVFCCEGSSSHTIDSVFNLALVVKDVDAVTARVRSRGGQVLREPSNLPGGKGHVRYSIVRSCCGNIVHTLIDKRKYSGIFLPGFETIGNHEGNGLIDFNRSPLCDQLEPAKDQDSVSLTKANMQTHDVNDRKSSSPPISTHIDHVTFVCEVGKSKDLLSWYESCFGMKRFMTNRDESETEGFVLGDNIGLRLKVMEYWKCAESGLAFPGAHIGDAPLKLVIAEPLPEVSGSHVDAFLRAHSGPGVQHIGLHTSTMVATVDFMARNGVVFRKAPPVYYEEGIKLDEIKDAGHAQEVERFKELGILLDTEADVFTEYQKERDEKSYLMQVFTKPLFDEETFFLEVIQRRGARGFGAGNITALAKSIMLQSQQFKDSEHNEH